MSQPQTFEEFPVEEWANWEHGDLCREVAKLRAAIASQQAEIERLKQYVPKHAKSTATFDELWLEAADAEAKLARYEAVVEAARKYRAAEKRYDEGTLKERVYNSALKNVARVELDAALAALDETAK